MTDEFGIRQRFISGITDAKLQEDKIYSGKKLCKSKESIGCIEKCPVSAVKDKFIEIEIEGKKFQLPEIDLLRCDWAKKYALIQDEGAKYLGYDVDIKPPKNITKNNLCEALKRFDQIGEHSLYFRKSIDVCSM